MENEAKFKEGIKSYRTRLVIEFENIRVNLVGFDDPRNTPSGRRIMIQYMRKSLDKINSYFHNIEMIVEKEYAENAENVNKNVERTSISRGENLQEELNENSNER